MRGVIEPPVVERCEDGDKEKKKARRRPRRSKQNASASGLLFVSLISLYNSRFIRD